MCFYILNNKWCTFDLSYIYIKRRMQTISRDCICACTQTGTLWVDGFNHKRLLDKMINKRKNDKLKYSNFKNDLNSNYQYLLNRMVYNSQIILISHIYVCILYDSESYEVYTNHTI